MFKKVLESLEKANVRAKLMNGGLACPDCGGSAGELPQNWGDVMVCAACGARASLTEWAVSADSDHRAGIADQPPVDTKIRRETVGENLVIWHIPATGKFGFFMVFSVLWLLITGAVSGGFLVTILTGGKIEGDQPAWVMIPFFGIFWAVGLRMLYAAFRQKYMTHRVSIGSDTVTLRKEMFGKSSEKSLARSSIAAISQKEFYQQNYKPIYGIEIRGLDGKMRFGSSLTDDDKAWLVADFNKVLQSGKKPASQHETNAPAGALAPIKLVNNRKSVFSITIPKPGACAIVGSLIFAIIGIGFACIGIFAIEGEPFPKDQSGGVMTLFHFLLANGFLTIWTLISSIFAVAGVWMAFSTLKGVGKDRRIEGSESQIFLRTYQNGLVSDEKSFPRQQVHDIRGTESGKSNGTKMKRVELIVGDKTEKIANWMDGDLADKLIREVKEALGK
jgi:uncharacterized membrane protein